METRTNPILHIAAAIVLNITAACGLITPEGIPEEEIPEEEDILSIYEARECIGRKGAWVEGYIAGGDLSAKSISFTPPFSAASNMAIAPRPDIAARDSCLSVQLPKGALRDSLNLVSHPELLGKHIYLKADIAEAYFGLVGLKNTDRYIMHSLK